MQLGEAAGHAKRIHAVPARDPADGQAIEDFRIAPDGPSGPLAKSLTSITQPADRRIFPTRTDASLATREPDRLKLARLEA
jgi:hypothetical protein